MSTDRELLVRELLQRARDALRNGPSYMRSLGIIADIDAHLKEPVPRSQRLRDAGFTSRESIKGPGGLLRDKFKEIDEPVRGCESVTVDEAFRRAAVQDERKALADDEIESVFKAHGGRWTGDAWVIEDADLHPFVRSLAALPQPATVPSGLLLVKDVGCEHSDRLVIAMALRKAADQVEGLGGYTPERVTLS